MSLTINLPVNVGPSTEMREPSALSLKARMEALESFFYRVGFHVKKQESPDPEILRLVDEVERSLRLGDS